VLDMLSQTVIRSGCLALVLTGLLLTGCGPSSQNGNDNGDAGPGDADVPDYTDSDDDTISDRDEGAAEDRDTDGDGIPDYLDDDSDGDGIPDALEAGDDDVTTPPRDSDGDGVPDFRDRDSDDDGLADGDEDLNHNGVVDPGETNPRDADTDDDGVTDLIERVAGTDPGNPNDNPQARGNFVFLVPYQAPPDPTEDELRFRTNLQRVDLYFLEDISISMDAELHAIHDNVVTILDELTCDPGETWESCPADCPDTCGDGFCDAAETSTSCPYDCLGNCGDGVCTAAETAETCAVDCPATCGDRTCDAGETPATCPTDCAGACGDGICAAGEQPSFTACIPDIQSGAGAFGTTSMSNDCDGHANCAAGEDGTFAYRNLQSIQADPAVTQTVLPDDCWGSGCWEPGLAALFYTVTGMGSAAATAAGYTVPPLAVPEPEECKTGYRGYPCFRPDSLPIVLLIGDEPFSECYLPDGVAQGTCVNGKSSVMNPKAFPIVAGAVNALGAKVIGVKGSGGQAELTADLEALCEQTGSVDADGTPYVYSGADAAAGQAIADGIRNLVATLPLDMTARIVDDASDTVDTVAAFVDYLETHTPGTVECIDWPAQADVDLDAHPDSYLDVPPGTPVCWQIVVKQNETVEPTDQIQIFKAQVVLTANGATLLDTRTVYFVVPPDLSGGPVD
jgi:hypothetical protein